MAFLGPEANQIQTHRVELLGLRQLLQEPLPASVISKDQPPLVATHPDMVNRP
jgi:hypothetical protein